MTSTNDGKDVKSNQTSGQKGKSYFIELYKSLDSRLSDTGQPLPAAAAAVCAAWRRVHSLCAHSASSTHAHLVTWIQRHSARLILLSKWQSPNNRPLHSELTSALDSFIEESHFAILGRNGVSPDWENLLLRRAEWLKGVLDNPWKHPVLVKFLDDKGDQPQDEELLEWLSGERGVTFATRLRQMASSKCEDIALRMATAVLSRVRAASPAVADIEQLDEKDKTPSSDKTESTFECYLRKECGFTNEVWDLLVDLEFVLLHKGEDNSHCIALAKQTPLRLTYQLIERLSTRLELFPLEKKLWKNAKDVAMLISQVTVARCMVLPMCAGNARTALYWSCRALCRLQAGDLRRAAAALAAPARTAKHLHTLAAAVHAQLAEDEQQMPFVCEMYVRAITFGMNELEKLKLKTEEEKEARSTEQTLASWFIQLGTLLKASVRVKCECTLTAFSVHPSPAMYERIKAAPVLTPVAMDIQEPKLESNSEFGSWATDSRSQTNFVKTSETLNLKQIPNQANVLSTAILTEGEALGLGAELCQDIAVLLSGPRVKTLSWDMDRELLLENCRTYMERTHGGTRALTTELKYLNLDLKQYQHLPEEADDDEDNVYYGIEKGYEHLVEFEPQPEEIWQNDLLFDTDTESADSDCLYGAHMNNKRKQGKGKRLVSEDEEDPLSMVAEAKRIEKKERPHSKERSKERRKKNKTKEKPKDNDEEGKEQTKKCKRKERKKEKKERKKKENSYTLGNLIGVKVANMDLLTKGEIKPENSCGINSDSLKLPNNNDTIEYDGQFSMDELKSPDRKSTESMRRNSDVYSPNGKFNTSFSTANPTQDRNSPISVQVRDKISKLLQFRRQKYSSSEDSSSPQRQNSDPNLFSGSKMSKPLTKLQSEQINMLKNEINNLLVNPAEQYKNTNHMSYERVTDKQTCSRTIPVSFFQTKQEKPQQNIPQPSQHTVTNLMNSNAKEENESPQKQCVKIKSEPMGLDSHQKIFQDFINQMQESENSLKVQKVVKSEVEPKPRKPVLKADPVVPSERKPDITATPQCAKLNSQQINLDNAPNTFARRSYIYKNSPKTKRTPLNSISAEIDRRISDLKIQNIKNKDVPLNKILNAIDQPRSKYHLENSKLTNYSSKQPELSNMLLAGKIPIHKDILAKSLLKDQMTSRKTSQTNQPNEIVQTKNSSFTEKDHQDLLNLVRQQSKLNAQLKTETKTWINIPDRDINNIPIKQTRTKNSTQILKKQIMESKSKPIIPESIDTVMKIPYVKKPIILQKTNNDTSTERKVISVKKSLEKTLKDPSKFIKITRVDKSHKTYSRSADNILDFANQTCLPSADSCNDVQQQDWTRVMDELLSHKTSRGPSAIDLVLKKKTLGNIPLNTSSIPVVTYQCQNQRISKPHTTEVHNVPKNTLPNLPAKLATNAALSINKTSVIKPPQTESQKTQMQNDFIKKLNLKDVTIVFPEKKQFTCSLPKNDDPFISGIPNADHDLLEELMDDDLRKEIEEVYKTEQEVFKSTGATTKAAKPLLNQSHSVKVNTERNPVIMLNHQTFPNTTISKPSLNASMKLPQKSTQQTQLFHIPKAQMVEAPSQNLKAKPQILSNVKVQYPRRITPNLNAKFIQNIPKNIVISSNSGTKETYDMKTSKTTNTDVNTTHNNTTNIMNQQSTVESTNVFFQQQSLPNLMLMSSNIYDPFASQIRATYSNASQDYVTINNVPKINVYQTTQTLTPPGSVIIGNITLPVPTNSIQTSVLREPFNIVQNLPSGVQIAYAAKDVMPLMNQSNIVKDQSVASQFDNQMSTVQNQYSIVRTTAQSRPTASISYAIPERFIDAKETNNSTKVSLAPVLKEPNIDSNRKLVDISQHTEKQIKPTPAVMMPAEEIKSVVIPDITNRDEEKLLLQNQGKQHVDENDFKNDEIKIIHPDSEHLERIKQKRLAYMRRKIFHSDKYSPIPLGYKPIMRREEKESENEVLLTKEIMDRTSMSKEMDMEKVDQSLGTVPAATPDVVIAQDIPCHSDDQRRSPDELLITANVHFTSEKKTVQLKKQIKATKVLKSSKKKVDIGKINKIPTVSNTRIIDKKASITQQNDLTTRTSKRIRNRKIDKATVKYKDIETMTKLEKSPARKSPFNVDKLSETFFDIEDALVLNKISKPRPLQKTVTDSLSSSKQDVAIEKTKLSTETGIIQVESYEAESPLLKEPSENIKLSLKTDLVQDKTSDLVSLLKKPLLKEPAPTTELSTKINLDHIKILEPESLLIKEKVEDNIETANPIQQLKLVATDEKALSKCSTIDQVFADIVSPQIQNDNAEKQNESNSQPALLQNDSQSESGSTKSVFTPYPCLEDLPLDMEVTEERVVPKFLPQVLVKNVSTIEIKLPTNKGLSKLENEIEKTLHVITKDNVVSSPGDKLPKDLMTTVNEAAVRATSVMKEYTVNPPEQVSTANQTDALVHSILESEPEIESILPDIGNINAKVHSAIGDDIVITRNQQIKANKISESDNIIETQKSAEGLNVTEKGSNYTDLDSIVVVDHSLLSQVANMSVSKSFGNVIREENEKTADADEVIILDSPVKAKDSLTQPNNDIDFKKASKNLFGIAKENLDIPKTYKDSISIQEIPSKNPDPNRKVLRIMLPNKKVFRATLEGHMNVSVDTLFEHPQLRSLLLSGQSSQQRYTFNFQQISTNNHEIVRTRIIEVNPKPTLNTETVIISDDDDDDDKPLQKFETEFGKFSVKILGKEFKKHQDQLVKKCYVPLERCDTKKENIKAATIPLDPINTFLENLCEELFNEGADNLTSVNRMRQTTESSTVKKRVSDVIEIDDSSNDSVHISNDLHRSSPNIQPEAKITEYKNLLLKDLGVLDEFKCREENSLKAMSSSTDEIPVDVKNQYSEIMMRKYCVKLVRCDKLVKPKPQNENEMSTIELDRDNEDFLDDKSNPCRSRTGSFSLLNNIQLFHDQPTTVDRSFQVLDRFDTFATSNNIDTYERTSPVMEVFDIISSLHDATKVFPEIATSLNVAERPLKYIKCSSEWFATKQSLHSKLKNDLEAEAVIYKSKSSESIIDISLNSSSSSRLSNLIQPGTNARSLISIMTEYFNHSLAFQYKPASDMIEIDKILRQKRKMTPSLETPSNKLTKRSNTVRVERLEENEKLPNVFETRKEHVRTNFVPEVAKMTAALPNKLLDPQLHTENQLECSTKIKAGSKRAFVKKQTKIDCGKSGEKKSQSTVLEGVLNNEIPLSYKTEKIYESIFEISNIVNSGLRKKVNVNEGVLTFDTYISTDKAYEKIADRHIEAGLEFTETANNDRQIIVDSNIKDETNEKSGNNLKYNNKVKPENLDEPNIYNHKGMPRNNLESTNNQYAETIKSSEWNDKLCDSVLTTENYKANKNFNISVNQDVKKDIFVNEADMSLKSHDMLTKSFENQIADESDPTTTWSDKTSASDIAVFKPHRETLISNDVNMQCANIVLKENDWKQQGNELETSIEAQIAKLNNSTTTNITGEQTNLKDNRTMFGFVTMPSEDIIINEGTSIKKSYDIQETMIKEQISDDKNVSSLPSEDIVMVESTSIFEIADIQQTEDQITEDRNVVLMPLQDIVIKEGTAIFEPDDTQKTLIKDQITHDKKLVSMPSDDIVIVEGMSTVKPDDTQKTLIEDQMTRDKNVISMSPKNILIKVGASIVESDVTKETIIEDQMPDGQNVLAMASEDIVIKESSSIVESDDIQETVKEEQIIVGKDVFLMPSENLIIKESTRTVEYDDIQQTIIEDQITDDKNFTPPEDMVIQKGTSIIEPEITKKIIIETQISCDKNVITIPSEGIVIEEGTSTVEPYDAHKTVIEEQITDYKNIISIPSEDIVIDKKTSSIIEDQITVNENVVSISPKNMLSVKDMAIVEPDVTQKTIIGDQISRDKNVVSMSSEDIVDDPPKTIVDQITDVKSAISNPFDDIVIKEGVTIVKSNETRVTIIENRITDDKNAESIPTKSIVNEKGASMYKPDKETNYKYQISDNGKGVVMWCEDALIVNPTQITKTKNQMTDETEEKVIKEQFDDTIKATIGQTGEDSLKNTINLDPIRNNLSSGFDKNFKLKQCFIESKSNFQQSFKLEVVQDNIIKDPITFNNNVVDAQIIDTIPEVCTHELKSAEKEISLASKVIKPLGKKSDNTVPIATNSKLMTICPLGNEESNNCVIDHDLSTTSIKDNDISLNSDNENITLYSPVVITTVEKVILVKDVLGSFEKKCIKEPKCLVQEDVTDTSQMNYDIIAPETEKNDDTEHLLECVENTCEVNLETADNTEILAEKKIKEVYCDDNLFVKNATLLSKDDTDFVLKGIEYEDPEMGPCYAFPLCKNSDDSNDILNDSTESVLQLIDNNVVHNVSKKDFELDFNVKIPKFTYSKNHRKRKSTMLDVNISSKRHRRSSSCKAEHASQASTRKFRKGKNIDYPKLRAGAPDQTSYVKAFQNIFDYCSSVKFSHSLSLHTVPINVPKLLQSWPLWESRIANDDIEIDSNFLVDIDVSEADDPLKQTLVEELSAEYKETDFPQDTIGESNLLMGFGEGSGRVIQNLGNFGIISNFSAATLSDVKQYQPFSLSDYCNHSDKESHKSVINEQIEIVKRYITTIELHNKVRSFFKKTSFELINESRKDCVKYKKDEQLDFPFDSTWDSFNPYPVEMIVHVVQVGQLPVSAAAQNPVTCDPRVTQVSDASPSQCTAGNSPNESQQGIKTEYTELTTADLSLPNLDDYTHDQEMNSRDMNTSFSNEDIPIETQLIKSEVKVELVEETDDKENEDYRDCDLGEITDDNSNNLDYSAANNTNDLEDADEDMLLQVKQQNGPTKKTDQIAHAMSAAGITTTPEPEDTTEDINIANAIIQNVRQEVVDNIQTMNNCPKAINAIALQQALAQILPPPLNQTNGTENVQPTQNQPQILHIVQGKNASGSQITLLDNTQQTIINNANATPLLHIVQNKNVNTTSNGTAGQQQNHFSGISLVDTGLQGGNQLLQILNAGNPKNANAGQLLKRVNLLTNLTNVQGTSDGQKMVQFVCKSADGKSIQLNAPHQRGMVLRLQPIETPKPAENLDQNAANKDTNSEIKSRSIYEENYAKFIQSSSGKLSAQDKSTSLPKFNQAFGKPVFQEGNQKPNDIDSNNLPVNHNPENSETTDSAINLDQLGQIGSPPLLLRKPVTQTSQSQTNLVQQIKQTIAPMNIQTMHGGVIYTRQIPVNIGGGQTINLITVPSTERIDESGQNKQNQSDIEPSIIKIVPQNQTAPNAKVTPDDNSTVNVSCEGQNPQPQPVLTQMRIKLPMLSKTPQMMAGARVVRPSFFQIQRNVIGGANPGIYQQLVLTTAPPLGQQAIRLPQAQTKTAKVPENQSSNESQMSSSTLEQLREFDMVLEQVKERSTGQPKSHTSTDATDSPASTTSIEGTTQVLYSIGGTQSLNVAYVNRKAAIVTPATSTYVRSPDSSGIVDSPTSSSHSQIPHTVTSESPSNETSQPKPLKISSKHKSRPKSHHHPSSMKINTVPPKTSTQKPLEDEQTTQRILYILAEYKEQVENSPDKDKPAPRRRTNPPTNPSGSSKRKKSGSRRPGMRDSSPIGDDSCRTMGSEDSSCGTSQGDCTENCLESHSPQDSPRKVVRRLTFEQETNATSRIQPQRNVIVADGQTITVARGTAGKPATAVLMPANYILPVSMVKGGQQIAIVTNRGPKILTVSGGEGGTTNAVLLQRLIGPAGLKPVLTRPGVRHVRLPTAALHNLQAFNLTTSATTVQPPDSTASPAPASIATEMIDSQADTSPWAEQDSNNPRPERASSPEGSEPWNIPSSSETHDYNYEDAVRVDNLDRTVLDPIPDRYSPELEAQRIFDKMFETVESKKSFLVDSQDDSRCVYDIDPSDCDEKQYQVVQKKDGTRQHRLAHVSAAALRHKYAILEHELRLQKSLSEECEDLGVDSPSASELFPEAELLFAASPAAPDHAHEANRAHTPQPTILHQSTQPDVEDQIATDQLIPRDRQDMDVNLGLEDVGIVTVSEDGLQATIALDQEEFARSHPNTTFHSEPTEDVQVQPFTIAGIKSSHITSTIFHSNRTPTVLMTAPQTTVISQATAEPRNSTQESIKYADIDNMINSIPGTHANNINLSSVVVKDDNLTTRFDNLLNDSRELHLSSNASTVVHSASNAAQVIRRVCYEDDKRDSRFLMDEPDTLIAGNDAKMVAEDNSRDEPFQPMPADDEDNSSPERHGDLFWESNSASERSESRRPLDYSSDSDKCCKSPYDETNSTDSSGVGIHLRLHSVIKEARVERSGSAESSADDTHRPLRTYPPKRTYHAMDSETDRSLSGKTRAGESGSPDSSETRRRTGRGVVKKGCHCCNGNPAPPRSKKPKKKPCLDFAMQSN